MCCFYIKKNHISFFFVVGQFICFFLLLVESKLRRNRTSHFLKSYVLFVLDIDTWFGGCEEPIFLSIQAIILPYLTSACVFNEFI